MLHILGDLENFFIEAADGKVGKVKDFYFSYTSLTFAVLISVYWPFCLKIST